MANLSTCLEPQDAISPYRAGANHPSGGHDYLPRLCLSGPVFVYISNVENIVLKTAKIISSALMCAVFLPASSFARPAGAAYGALEESAYAKPVTYDFGFFASLLIVIALGALLYILKNRTAAKKQ